jgi:hypothetical protein
MQLREVRSGLPLLPLGDCVQNRQPGSPKNPGEPIAPKTPDRPQKWENLIQGDDRRARFPR